MKNRIISATLAFILLFAVLALASCKEEGPDLKNDMYLFLVNKKNPAGEGYIPENLVSVNTYP